MADLLTPMPSGDPRTVTMAGDDLVTIFGERVRQHPGRQAVIELSSDGQERRSLTYRSLVTRAIRLQPRLAEYLVPGERVLLLHTAPSEFFVAFLACLYYGAVAVPVPTGTIGTSQTTRIDAINRDCRPRLALTDDRSCGTEMHGLPVVHTGELGDLDDAAQPGPAPDYQSPARPWHLAMLQYTSGSTGTPRGVRLTHANFVDNLQAATSAQHLGELDAADVLFVSWLPHFHDMGLAQLLGPLCLGGTAVTLSPITFLRSPVSWLDAISRYRAVSAASPNVGYDRCAALITPAQRAGLDLSSWRMALNGSETVRPATLARFARTFADCGFDARAFRPSYGLAEATVYVSGYRRPDDIRTLTVSSTAADERGEIVPSDSDSEGGSRTYAGCGRWSSGMELRILDPETGAPAQPHQIGEIWLRGASISAGYWSPEHETASPGAQAEPSEPAELNTGDLGFVYQDQLFVVGRRDSVFVVNGLNHTAEDVERTAQEAHPDLQPGGVTAFAADPDDASGSVTLVCELGRRSGRRSAPTATPPADLARQIEVAIRQAVWAEHRLGIARVVLTPAGAIPRTSSGKVQRNRCRDLLATKGLPQWT